MCPYCRLATDGSAVSCANCGAPIRVEERVSSSGWEEQPPVEDMARIRFGGSTCQIEGELVPTAEEEAVIGHLGPDLLAPTRDRAPDADDPHASARHPWDPAEAVRRLDADPEAPVFVALLDRLHKPPRENYAAAGTMVRVR